MTQLQTIYINGVLATIDDLIALIIKNERMIISKCPITGAVEIATVQEGFMKKQTIKIQGNEYTIIKNLSMGYFDRDFRDNFQEYKYICENGIYNNVDYIDYEVTKL